MGTEYDRRQFLKAGATVGAGLILSCGNKPAESSAEKQAPAAAIQLPPIDPVRVGFVGVGSQGSSHVRNYLNIEGVEIRAVCDLVEEKVASIQQLVRESGQPEPAGYSRGETDFKRLCERDDLDMVFTATPWEWHVPVCLEAMKTGKHAATEVPAAVTLEECWEMVETSEKTRRHCVMMENCCYGQAELMVLNMVRHGLLGELVHGEAGYLHDLRALKFGTTGEGPWRMPHSVRRNGNVYPTHGLGPLAECMNINRGDRFDFLVSMSSKSRGLNLYAEKEFGADSPQAKKTYALGDVNSSLIRTKNGVTIILIHDCDTPRPYSRINLVQGTGGIFQGYPDRIYVEGKSEPHTWEPLENYAGEYEHPLWKEELEGAKGAGHGGMDYLEDYRLVDALRTGRYPDMDVYDAAAWSAVSALSERSVAEKSRPVDFPDFTRGMWKTNSPIFICDL
ncbi:MAG: Gfo/Idh/MocA family oxidoreductase [Candidatus Glassbacteria bacterium]|nr:Gfo/Idh/MocA family oxidoreductase [Candidatus Glassbacteria bacterium]